MATVVGIFKGLDCNQIVATEETHSTTSFPVSWIFDCSTCHRRHAFIFQKKVFVSTPHLQKRFEEYSDKNHLGRVVLWPTREK